MNSCVQFDNTYSLERLVRLYKDNAEGVVEHTIGDNVHVPHDFAYAFFWSFLAYNKQLLRNLFNSKKYTYSLHMDTGKQNTPFVYVLSNLSKVLDNGGYSSSEAVIIGIRGTNKKTDLTSTLMKPMESLKVPQSLQSLDLSPEEFKAFDYEIQRVFDTMHDGVLNHGLGALTMIMPIVSGLDKHTPIYVHGHSLGAACAAIVSHFLSVLGYTKVHCTCLSCPPVFNNNCPIVSMDVPFFHYYTQGDPIVETKWISGDRLVNNLANGLFRRPDSPRLSAALPQGRHSNSTIMFAPPALMRPEKLLMHNHFEVPSQYIQSFPNVTGSAMFMETFSDNVTLCKSVDTLEVVWDEINIAGGSKTAYNRQVPKQKRVTKKRTTRRSSKKKSSRRSKRN